MQNPWIAAVLNFFTLGVGTLYNGKRMVYGTLMTIGAILAAYVEFSLNDAAPELYPYAFASFFVLAVAMAWDGYREAQDR